jgi:hypothetical protein
VHFPHRFVIPFLAILLTLLVVFLFWLYRSDENVIPVFIVETIIQRPGPVITVKQGKSIELRIESDHSEEVHIEGYHAFTPVNADTIAVLKIDALTAGQFPIVLDKAKKRIGTFSVVP